MKDVLLRPGQARTLAMLGVVTVLMVALATFAVSMQRMALTSDFDTRLMFPDLAEQVNDAARVEIVNRLDTVTVVRDGTDGETWRLEEKAGHPARAELVKRTVVGLADLELVEQRTALPDWHKHINLTDPGDKGTGVRVTVFDGEGEELASLIAGKLEGSADIDGTGTIYVRRTAEDQAYVARGSFNLEQNAATWLDTGVLDVAPGRIASVDVTPAEGPAYVVERVSAAERGEGGDEPVYRIADLPETLQPVTDYAINGIGNALVGLQFTDVVAQGDIALTDPVTSVFRTDDGLLVTAKAEKQARAYYAIFDATAADDASEEVRREAAALADRFARYAFSLPTAKGADLTRSFDTLTEPKSGDEAAVDLDALDSAN